MGRDEAAGPDEPTPLAEIEGHRLLAVVAVHPEEVDRSAVPFAQRLARGHHHLADSASNPVAPDLLQQDSPVLVLESHPRVIVARKVWVDRRDDPAA